MNEARLTEIERNAVTSCRRNAPDDLSTEVFALVAEVRRLRERQREALVVLTDPEGDSAEAIKLLSEGVA